MLLLTLREWIGATRDSRLFPHVMSDKTIGMVTRLSLGKAILLLNYYEIAYRKRYKDVDICFSLLSVSEIEDLTDMCVEMARLSVVEDLTSTLPEISTK